MRNFISVIDFIALRGLHKVMRTKISHDLNKVSFFEKKNIQLIILWKELSCNLTSKSRRKVTTQFLPQYQINKTCKIFQKQKN